MIYHYLLIYLQVYFGCVNMHIYPSPSEEPNINYVQQHLWTKSCSDKLQSPIKLYKDYAHYTSFPELEFKHHREFYQGTFYNTGNCLKIYIKNPEPLRTLRVEVNRGGLPSKYSFNHIEFHYTSEHIVEDIRQDLEIQFVYKAKGLTLAEALITYGGIAIFSVFGNSSDKGEAMVDIEDDIEYVSAGFPRSRTIDNINIGNLLPDTREFYRYIGSTTSPPCTPNVIWTVFTDTIGVTPKVMHALKSFVYRDPKSHKHGTNIRRIKKFSTRLVIFQSKSRADKNTCEIKLWIVYALYVIWNAYVYIDT